MNRPLTSTLVLAATAVAACGGRDGEAGPPATDSAQAAAATEFRGRIYERNFVFTTLASDSAFVVPWLMSAQTRPGGVVRRTRGLLARGNTWDPFYDETWETPPTRVPWRILPHGPLRLVVGDGDAVEGLIYSEGQRQLELEVSGGALIEWTGMRGQIYRLMDAAAYLSDQRIAGIVLDMSRVHEAEAAAKGDWGLLVSGDSLQVVLENPDASPPGTAGGYRLWARLDYRDLQWPSVTVEWADVSAFQPARQDIPVSWALTSDDGDVTGAFQVQSAHVQAGQGEGPLLPVDALFLVVGSLRIEGRSFPVRGLFRHSRP